MSGNGIYNELGIRQVAETMFSDPVLTSRIITSKARELSALLDAPSTLSSRESAFRHDAENDKEAFSRAAELVNNFLSVISDEDPKVLFHIKSLLNKSATEEITNAVRTAASNYRSDDEEIVDKEIVHAQYVELRKAYEAYRSLMNSGTILQLENMLPAIPSKPGNYKKNSSASGIRSWTYEYKGETFISPYSVVRKAMTDLLMMETPEDRQKFNGMFHDRFDCHDWINANPIAGIKINEFK